MSEAIATAVGPAHLRRSDRKTLGITVHPDGSLELVAPHRAPINDVLAKVAKRAPWIRRQRLAFVELNANRPPKRYSGGATHRYLGRQYRLKIRKGSPPTVRLLGGYFHITASTPAEQVIRRMLDAWMLDHARVQFENRLQRWKSWCERNRLPVPQIRIRSMSMRWGSARRDGTITLNPELVRASSTCIDYVLVHEVCHLRHPHHGSAFFKLLSYLCPTWREAKLRLERTDL